MNMMDDAANWREYEKVVIEYLQLNHPDAEVTHNVCLPGRLSGVPRQVDILVKETLSGVAIVTGFEAKYYKRRVDVKGVEEAIGLFRDIGIDRGVMVTTQGYSEAALRRANADDVDIELDIVNLAELGPFQSDGGALPYAGAHGAAIPAPLGWIIDGSRSPIGPARLYRRGLTFDQALAEPEFMYVGYWTKDEAASTAEQLVELQNANIIQAFPSAQITVDQLDLGGTKKGYVRTAVDAYAWLEITGYVEFEQFILFVVLHTSELVERRNRRKLEYVVRKALPFSVRYGTS